MIRFHFSIFEILITAQYQQRKDIQSVILQNRITKSDLLSRKTPLKGGVFYLEQLQLLSLRYWRNRLLPIKKFNVSELLICEADNTHMTVLGQERFYALDMHLRVFAAGAMPYVGGELKHSKAVFLQILSKIRISTPVFLGFCRQVEQYQYPHNTVFAKAFNHRSG